MKYTISIEIDLPRETVVQLLADPAQMPKWLRGMVLHEPLSGTHGEAGTTSRVVMQMGRQRIEGTETITRREPAIPGVVHFEREIVIEGMWNAVRDRLTEAGVRLKKRPVELRKATEGMARRGSAHRYRASYQHITYRFSPPHSSALVHSRLGITSSSSMIRSPSTSRRRYASSTSLTRR